MEVDLYREEYKRLIVPFAENKPRITIDDDKITGINNLVNEIVKAKLSEAHHRCDHGSEYKRFYTGLLGEAAMEKYFGIDIIDKTVGDSKKYNVADLSSIGLNIGIKTVEIWKFPIVHKVVERPELINIRRDDKTVVFFGYATKEVLSKFQNDDFILSNALRARGTKSAFWGFSELIPIKTMDELIQTYNKYDK